MSVTEDDVAAAYRMLLGREASAQERTTWLHVASVSALRTLFLASPEFERQLPARNEAAVRLSQRLPQDIPRIPVEWETGPETQDGLLAYVTDTWTALGREEPHWSVLSLEAFKAENLEPNAAAFYSSGAGDAARVKATLARHGLSPEMLPRIAEYGCGVGRVTPYLAALFSDVVGIDISESHLGLAAEAVAKSGRHNVRLSLARAPAFGMLEPFDVWFSHIVLQHNPPPVIALVLRRMFAMLAPGGVAIFQVPTYVPGYSFEVARYLEASKSGTIEVHCLPQPVVFQFAHAAGCVPLEVREDTAMGHPWLSNTFVFRKLH